MNRTTPGAGQLGHIVSTRVRLTALEVLAQPKRRIGDIIAGSRAIISLPW